MGKYRVILMLLLLPAVGLFSAPVDTLSGLLTNQHYSREKVSAYQKLITYYSYRNPSKAVTIIHAALKDAVVASDSPSVALFYGYLSEQYCIMGNYLAGFNYGYKALIIYELLSDSANFYNEIVTLTKCYRKSGINDYFFTRYVAQTQDYYRRQNDLGALLKLDLYWLSRHSRASDEDSGLEQEILSLLKQVGGNKIKVLTYTALAEYYQSLGKRSKAQEALDKALEFAKTNEEKGFVLLRKADYFLSLPDARNAYLALLEAQLTFNNLQDVVHQTELNILFSRFYYLTEELNKAILHAQKAYRSALRYDLIELLNESLLELAKSYTQLGYGDLALETYRRYSYVKDSVFSLNNFYPVVKHQISLNSINQKRENIELKLQKERQVTINRRQRLLLALVSFLSVALFFALLLLVKQYKANKAVNERMLKFASISLEGIIILDGEKIIEVNDKFCEQSLFEAQELIGKNIFDLFPEGNHQYVKRFLSVESSLFSDLEIIRADRETIIVEIFTRKLSLANKKVTVVSVHDITQYIQATKELIETQNRFRALLDASPDGVIIVDTNRKLQFASRSALQTLGISSACFDWQGDDFSSMEPEKYALLEQIIYKTLMNKETNIIEINFKRGDEQVIVECRVSEIQDYTNSVSGYFIIMREITERRLTEIALQKSEARFRGLFNTAKDGIVIQDEHGRIVNANNSAAKIFETSRKKLIGTYFEKLLPWRNKFEYDSLAMSDSVFETPAYKSNGEQIFIQISVSKLSFEDEKIYILIIRDITEFKRNQQNLQQYAEELKVSNISKTKLFSIIAHDLRGPIGNLKTMMEIILENPEDYDTNSMREILQLLKNSSVTTYELLENLLQWTKSQLNIIEYNPEIYDLGKVINDILPLFEDALARKDLKLINKIEQGSAQILADVNMLRIILRNLIFNAIKFTKKGGIITLYCYEKDNDTVVAVEDTGVGMTREQIAKVFDQSEFFSTYGTEQEKGSGLGLRLVMEFVRRNNGKLWVESQAGKGSTFYFSLPKA